MVFYTWAELLPFVQLPHNSAYFTPEESPHFLVSGPQMNCLPVSFSDFRPPPRRRRSSTSLRKLSKNEIYACGVASRSTKERADKHAVVNEILVDSQL